MTTPLLGQMMDVPLTVSSLLAHAARHFGSRRNRLAAH